MRPRVLALFCGDLGSPQHRPFTDSLLQRVPVLAGRDRQGRGHAWAVVGMLEVWVSPRNGSGILAIE